MSKRASDRIGDYVAALPIHGNMHVLEIGCGPGVAARLVSRKLESGSMLAIDRSAKAIAAAVAGSKDEIDGGRLRFRRVAVEDFALAPDEAQFDLVFAMRVGALDGRHPALEARALTNIKAALKPEGLLFIDGQVPVKGRDIAGVD